VSYQPSITLSYGTYQKVDVIGLKFAYDPTLIQEVKKIKGSKYDADSKDGSLKTEDFNLHILFEKLKEIAYLDYKALRKPTENENPNLKAAKDYSHRLGHQSTKTTEIYTHVSNKEVGRIINPLDEMMGKNK
jgi:hypothetical protein